MEDEDGFLDYTTATAWEAFCAEVEAKLREWKKAQEDGEGLRDFPAAASPSQVIENNEGDQVHVWVLEAKLPQFRPEKYSVALHYPPMDHYLSKWLALGEGEPFVLLYPNSFSGCVLDKEEGVALLSALSTSATSLKFPHPLLIPMRDRQRRSFEGVHLRPGGHVARLQTDCITGRLKAAEMPPLSVVEGYHSESRAGSVVERGRGAAAAGGAGQAASTSASVTREFELTWTLPESESDMCIWIDDWNAACPWYPWAEYEDPIAGIRLGISWDNLRCSDVQTDLDSFQRAGGSSGSSQSVKSFELSSLSALDAVGEACLKLELKDEVLSDVMWHRNVMDTMKKSSGGYFFAQMVSAFHSTFQLVERAKGVSQLSQDSFWDQYSQVPQIPSKNLLETQVESIFNRRAHVTQNFGGLENDLHSLPVDNLVGYLSMYALSYGDNPRAISLLWKRFISGIRLGYWEERELLPRMVGFAGIDHSCQVIEQKVQLIQLCILGLRSGGTLSANDLVGNDSGDSNPSMLTSDLVGEYDYMFTTTSNKKNKKEVWIKMHGVAARKMARSFRRAKDGVSFGDFKKHFRSSRYFDEFSKLCKSLAWNNFTKDRLKDVWNDLASAQEEEDHSEGRLAESVLCSRAEMALDWLEHVAPLELFKSLYCLGLSNCVNTLRASRNLELKPIADLVSSVKESVQDWVAKLPKKLATSDLAKDEEATILCLDLHLLEVSISFAESVVQKLVFLSGDVKAFLVDAFVNKLVTKEFSNGPTLELSLSDPFHSSFSFGESFRRQEESSDSVMLLHLRKQVVQLFTSAGEAQGPEDLPLLYTYLSQDLDQSMTRFASIVTV
ncbi:hypothetical protein A3770_05p39380 [Chloropicon primus]|uniref:Uncharacterized protein n=2 Tax=Chloropicon primus TaxID=1764295 RepID=A0A5B8MPX3_9CHLO|nr:hypothetical protein A3770_05p39380 [Chloropicon primus]|eukprot:QDZ21420.1 hypothetical protein A3770_05p39380 [Chloropicon primus]